MSYVGEVMYSRQDDVYHIKVSDPLLFMSMQNLVTSLLLAGNLVNNPLP